MSRITVSERWIWWETSHFISLKVGLRKNHSNEQHGTEPDCLAVGLCNETSKTVWPSSRSMPSIETIASLIHHSLGIQPN